MRKIEKFRSDEFKGSTTKNGFFMTTNERRLTFAYSKMCDIGNLFIICKDLICGSAYDKELVKDPKVLAMWYKLIDIEKQFAELRNDFGNVVDSITENSVR